jgi:4-amino-4-deoxychorismate lyase
MGYIETILITDKIENLKFHNERMNQVRKVFYNASAINLSDYMEIIPDKRVRVIYEKDIKKIEYFELQKREFKKLKIVYCDDIEYSYKSENRDKLNSLKVKDFDEIIIVKNGLITDTTISNLAFFDGEKWITPKIPLLKGTKREELLQKGFLKEKDIKIDEIKNYQKVAMMNAIIGFYEMDIECIKK